VTATTLDAETIAYIQALVDDAPPLSPAVVALIARTFTTSTPADAQASAEAA